MAGVPAKQRLLEALVAHLTEHGLRDTSLRGLAAAVGTSHRMLAYHFGGREELLEELTRTVEREQRAAFAELLDRPGLSPVEVMWAMYRRFVDPSLRGAERLFYELYARALTRPDAHRAFLDEVVAAWMGPLVVLFERLGHDPEEAADEARLALAVSRGLLLDLLATGDADAVEAAARRYLDRYEGR